MVDDENQPDLIPIEFSNQEIQVYQTDVIVIGVGGAGNNTVMRLSKNKFREVMTIAVNTDAQDLLKIHADRKILIGKNLTGGLGAGGDPEIGERSAEENRESIISAFESIDIVFLTGGLGGGTGTGALPVIGKLARERGALTIAIVTMPFTDEGIIRWENAQIGLERLRKSVDTVIVLRNDRLFSLYPDLPMLEAFKKGDEILINALTGLSELLLQKGLINLDFSDISMVIRDGPNAVIGVGKSNSENRAEEAARRAIEHPIMEYDIHGAQSALIQIMGGMDMTMKEARSVVRSVAKKLDPNARIIWGVTIDKSLKQTIQVLLIVSGLADKEIKSEIDNASETDWTEESKLLLSEEKFKTIDMDTENQEKNIFDIKESILATGEEITTKKQKVQPMTKTTMLFYKIYEEEAEGDFKRFDRGIQLLRENPGSRRAILDTRQAIKLLNASAQMFGFDEIDQLLAAIDEILACTQSREIEISGKILDSITLAMEMVIDLIETQSDGRGQTGYIVDRLKELKNEQLEYHQAHKTWIKH